MKFEISKLPNGGTDMEWISCNGNQLLIEMSPSGITATYSLSFYHSNEPRTYKSGYLASIFQLHGLLWDLYGEDGS